MRSAERLAGELRDALERGDAGALAERYAADALLDASVPGERSVAEGADAAASLLARLHPLPGRVVEWVAQGHDGGAALWLELLREDGSAVRQRHYLHTVDGRIQRHWIYAAPPRSTLPEPEVDGAGRRAIERVGPVERHSVIASTGWSGARLERALLRDGRSVVAKRVVPGGDWLSRQSGDRGREALLFRDVFPRLPPVIDHAILDVVEDADAWWLVMRDVSGELLDLHSPISREQHRFVMRAANEMWETFWGEQVPHVSTQAARLSLTSRARSREERHNTDLLPKQFEAAWEAFARAVEPDVAEAVLAITDDPGALAAALDARGTTLVHGDIRDEQIGLPGDRLVLLDWGVALQGHPAVDLAWYMCHCAWRIEATHDEIVEDFRRARGDADDPEALAMGLLSGLVNYGWILGHSAVVHPDPAEREWARAELDWWVPKARACLEHVWAPGSG